MKKDHSPEPSAAKIGKFELAKNGTVVLDEISEMPLPLQAKLLRVLQEKEIDRIGGTHPITDRCQSNRHQQCGFKKGDCRRQIPRGFILSN